MSTNNTHNSYLFIHRSDAGALSSRDSAKTDMRAVIERDVQAFFSRGGRVQVGRSLELKPLRETPRKPHPEPYRRKVSRRAKSGAVLPSNLVNVSQAMEMLGLDAEQWLLRKQFVETHEDHIARTVKVSGKTFNYFEVAYIERVRRGRNL